MYNKKNKLNIKKKVFFLINFFVTEINSIIEKIEINIKKYKKNNL